MATEATKILIKPLNGANYATWKVQCRMALIREGLWNIVNETEDAPEENVEKYRLRKDRALATIVLSMEPSLLYLLGPDPDDPAEVWKKLSDQFQKKSWANKLALRRKLYTLQLKDGQSIQKHIKSMTELFDELAIVGDPLDDENKVVHLLASLPKSFDMLVTALEASPEVPKIEVVTERLIHEETKQKEGIQQDEKAMSSRHGNRRGSGKGPQCHFCGKHGHFKRDCYSYKKSLKSDEPKDDDFKSKKRSITKQRACPAEEQSDDEEIIGLYVEQTKSEIATDWIIDSGASCHMSYDERLFNEITELDEPQEITVGDGFKVKATGVGTLDLYMKLPNGKTNHCRLSDVLYVPKLSYNLFSVSRTTKRGKRIEFEDSICKVLDKDRNLIAIGMKRGNIYHLNCVQQSKGTNEAVLCKAEDTKEAVWHRRYGHLGVKNLDRLAKDHLVEGFDYDVKKEEKFCEPCVSGKQHRTPFPKTGGARAEVLLGEIHSDVCGKIEEKSRGGAEYFVTFIDDKTRNTWVYTMKHKSETFQKFKEWKAMVEKTTGLKIKRLRTDNGGEYTSNEFEEYLKAEGMQHKTTIAKTPEQNGVAERMNRTLVETVRAMLADSKLPKRFWAEALSTAVYLRNRSPTRAVQDMTPYEAWTGAKPNVSNLRIFGCNAYAHVPKDERAKMDPKTKRCIFLGYGETTKGYRLYDEEKRRVFFSRDVVFNETKEPSQDKSSPEKEVAATEPAVDIDPHNEIPDDENDEPRPRDPPRPRREINPPNRYGDWVVHIAKQDDDPKSIREALSSEDKEKWTVAMEKEFNSLDENDVWDIVDLPKDRKAVGSKWVFKRKRDADGNVERYKARLVAQGFTQKNGIDYDETFSPVVRFESIRTIIALAAKYKLRLHQIDVTTAFLNGTLEEDIYMKQPEGFEVEGKEHMVCKLKKSIYGLKQSPRCWNQALDEHLKQMGFVPSMNDPCIYTLNTGGEVFILAVYVDDIILGGKSPEKIQQIINEIAQRFDVKDMGELKYFLGVKIVYLDDGSIWIGQPSYTKAVLHKFNMENSKTVATPVETGTKLIKATDNDKLFDQETYQSAVGCLLYLSTKTRPDIAFAVSNVAKFTAKPTIDHWTAVKRIMRYLNGTIHCGLRYYGDTKLVGYSDADWAGDLNDRKSISGYVYKISGAAVSWMSKKQTCVALSTAEAEYMALSMASQEAIWLRRLLYDLNEKVDGPITIYEDNQSTICMAENLKFHGRAKHIDIKHHYVRNQVNEKNIELKYCPSEYMIADMLTKGLSRFQFNKLKDMIGIHDLTDSE